MIKIFTTFSVFVFLIQLSYAHPHIFIDTEVTVCFNDAGISKLKVTFYFDKIFSEDLMQNFDANNNNSFEASEIEQIKENAFSNLVNFNYFVHAIYHNKKIVFKDVSDFSATIKGNVVSYSFTINTDFAIGANMEYIKIAFYDHSYFIDVSLNKETVKFENPNTFTYKYSVIEDKKLAYYYNQIYPDCMVISIKKN